jgi:hypothetical protein
MKLKRAGRRISRTYAFERIDPQPGKVCFVLIGAKEPDLLYGDLITSVSVSEGVEVDIPDVAGLVVVGSTVTWTYNRTAKKQVRYGTVITANINEVQDGKG